jgi:hypothetical protein
MTGFIQDIDPIPANSVGKRSTTVPLETTTNAFTQERSLSDANGQDVGRDSVPVREKETIY